MPGFIFGSERRGDKIWRGINLKKPKKVLVEQKRFLPLPPRKERRLPKEGPGESGRGNKRNMTAGIWKKKGAGFLWQVH